MATSTRVGRTRRKASRIGDDGFFVVADEVPFTAVNVESDSKTGSKNPNWKSQVRKVTQAGTPYARSGTKAGFVVGQVTGRYRVLVHSSTVTDTMWGELFLDNPPPVPLMPELPNLDVTARINFLKQCRQTYRAFQGGVFLGELREAISMIVRPASALRRGISAYLATAKKAGRSVRFSDRGRVLTKTWLEHSYGWGPLVNDIDAGMFALASSSHLIPEVIAGTGYDEFQGNHVTRKSVVPGSFVQASARFVDACDASVRYLGAVAWESENRARNWRSHWGLTLSDFAPTVWELIPYSFMVDYFSNIGAIIDASSFGTVGLRWGVRSSRSRVWTMMSPGPVTFISSSALEPRLGTASLRLQQLSRWSFARTLVDSVSVGLQDLQFRIPGVTDWRKWANLSALAIERLY
jgi:hypothetical protein